MLKAETITHWSAITPEMLLKPDVVPYKHEGSTYDQDGIRITGSRAWIDSVLSRLKPLLEFEGDETRLQLVYQQSTDRKDGRQLDAWNCYVQVHQRGDEAITMNQKSRAMRSRRADGVIQ